MSGEAAGREPYTVVTDDHGMTKENRMRNRDVKTAARTSAALAAAALLLSACGAQGAASTGTPSATATVTVTQAQIDTAMNTPTTLEFWSWVPNIQNEINLFEAKYPNIKVNLSNQGGNTAQYQKLRTSMSSGAVPDVAQIEYSFLPSFTLTKGVLDLAPYGFGSLKSDFTAAAWGQVTQGNVVYGLPQDVGPTGQLYRTDIFAKAGIPAPTSWDSYAADAATIKAKTGAYISDLPGNSMSPMLALLWQAGAKPFAFDGNKTVTIDLSSPAVKKVVSFWNDLIQKNLIATDNQLDDNWYQSVAAGKYASWLAAAWGPVFLQGTAAKTSGLWSATPMPQWDASKPASGNQGGSADVVMKDSKNPIAASQLVKFINDDPSSATMLATKQFLFPSNIATQKAPEFTDQTMAFYAGQKVNAVFTGISSTVDPNWQWLPYNDYVSSSFKETLGKAITDKTDLLTGLAAWETQIKQYGTQQGFTVK
jgi:multiple sugar transport system substrate-binding protein